MTSHTLSKGSFAGLLIASLVTLGLSVRCTPKKPLPPLAAPSNGIMFKQITRPTCWVKPGLGGTGRLWFAVVVDNKYFQSVSAVPTFTAYTQEGKVFSLSESYNVPIPPRTKAYVVERGTEVQNGFDCSKLQIVCRINVLHGGFGKPLHSFQAKFSGESLTSMGRNEHGDSCFKISGHVSVRSDRGVNVQFRFYDKDGILRARAGDSPILKVETMQTWGD
jgi:hypothetical protein